MVTRRTPGAWQRSIQRKVQQLAQNKFCFLNQSHENPEWNTPAVSRLWLYNLHYFDAPEQSLIDRWIRENPPGSRPGWEPYPLSLRIVNWIKYALNGNDIGPDTLASLSAQAEYLFGVVEYHLLANHLFANGKALVIAGLFFEGRAAAKWLEKGLEILTQEASEQILPDGGHFERSPMYHAIVLEDLLDLVNAGRAFTNLCGRALTLWEATAARMIGWLAQMVHGDGRISFFNDATFGIAPELCELLQYANALGISSESVPLGASGYVRLSNQNALVLFDAAPVGPDYQPGHAHADTLSFELSAGENRILVNSGISTYDEIDQRLAERGTAAHNTVRIDGADSSEVWKSFRVARRARPFAIETDGSTFVEAAHDGYRRLPDPVIHRRRLELKPHRLVITDSIEAKRQHTIEIFFHLYPGAQVDVKMDSRLKRTEESSTWHPGFNVSIPNTTLIGRWHGSCPAAFTSTVYF
jgi:uncharacterized heparinase superfamily protein